VPGGGGRKQQRLAPDAIVCVVWALRSLGALDIARFGWLLVALARGRWPRLGGEQLAVLGDAAALLGADGADMVAEVLPGALAQRVLLLAAGRSGSVEARA
jgi:hypothetical protein